MSVVELSYLKVKRKKQGSGCKLIVNVAESILKTMVNIAVRFSKRSKVFKKILLPLVFMFLLLIVFGLWFVESSKAPGKVSLEKRFVIQKGYGASFVGGELQKAGLIKSALAFKIYVSLTGKASKIQAGEYSLKGNLTLTQLTRELLRGPSEVWVTIPEGLRHEEIALKMADGLGITGVSRDKFIDEFLIKSKNKEGYLFPDTYLFPKTASASAVVSRMVQVFDQTVDFNVDSKTIILASIIERETLTGDERPIVAGILLKRLNAGWPLQADATVQYAVAKCLIPTATCNWWPRPLTAQDLAINSAYNTYKYPGLPPTPISNPGLSAIKAVINSQDSPYWYYIHDANGVIHYASTVEEHNSNVQRYLR